MGGPSAAGQDAGRGRLTIYRGYLLKEALAACLDGRQIHVATAKLREWLAWASRSRLDPFVRLARTVKKHLDGIELAPVFVYPNRPTKPL